VGIEPTHKGFADLSLTTWVPRRQFLSINQKPRPVTASGTHYFLTVAPILASRRNRADSSGGVGLM
jgi:hypothetical protein